jgi:single-strand DNA-binding protein
MYVNNVAVVGNLTSDPRQGEGDSRVVNFRMGVNRRRKPGEEQKEEIIERTEFIDVECWGPQADNISASLHRGDRTIVVGQLKYDQWNDEDGNPRSRVRIRAQAVGPSLEFQSIPEAATV